MAIIANGVLNEYFSLLWSIVPKAYLAEAP